MRERERERERDKQVNNGACLRGVSMTMSWWGLEDLVYLLCLRTAGDAISIYVCLFLAG